MDIRADATMKTQEDTVKQVCIFRATVPFCYLYRLANQSVIIKKDALVAKY